MLAEYSLKRQNLAEENIKELREAFERLIPYLLETKAEKRVRELAASIPLKVAEARRETEGKICRS